MNPRLKAKMRRAQIESRLAELETAAQTPETQKETADLLTEYAILSAAPASLPVEELADAEGAEFRALLDAASAGAILDSVISGAAPTGREAELQRHYGLQPDQFPLAMLRNMDAIRAAVTPAPADVGRNQAPVIPAVFPQSATAFLNIPMPAVPVGERTYTVLTTGASPGTPAENAAQAETTGAFTAVNLAPRRLQAAFFWSREDAARFAGMESALRQNLSDAMADELDKQVLTNDDQGLLHGTVLADNDATAEATYADYVSSAGYARVDGRWANTVRDIRVLMGGTTYAHAAGVYRATEADRSALDRLEAVTGGVRVSDHIPAANGNKQEAVIRRGRRMDAVAPMWQGVTMIPDQISKAAEGQIQLTAVALFAVKLLRAGGFHKQEFQFA